MNVSSISHRIPNLREILNGSRFGVSATCDLVCAHLISRGSPVMWRVKIGSELCTTNREVSTERIISQPEEADLYVHNK